MKELSEILNVPKKIYVNLQYYKIIWVFCFLLFNILTH